MDPDKFNELAENVRVARVKDRAAADEMAEAQKVYDDIRKKWKEANEELTDAHKILNAYVQFEISDALTDDKK